MFDMAAESPDTTTDARVIPLLKQYWGYDTLRPLQSEAITAGIAQRDSLVVLPTGGGKSLCYQIPPLVADRLDIVVSPLIALMKDQVDGLRQNGVPAAAVYSGQTPDEQRQIARDAREGKLRLLLLAPERVLKPRFLAFARELNVRAVAIDEAHCISHWGHDFRPEYRQLARLREELPAVSLHAFTATATERVRQDVVEQLKLRNPTVLVGDFDRPNLVFRVEPRIDLHGQLQTVLDRHRNEAVIIYCITRKETEEVAAVLRTAGFKAEHYHAGLDSDARRDVQDRFAREQLDVIVATVAFGMGIDRSNVRCVVHTALPKSVEHYQQEAGRAGRDGLEAECVLLYSPADAMQWERLMRRSAGEGAAAESALQASLELLAHMRGFAGAFECRHRIIKEYFGQRYERDNCGACDVCLQETKPDAEATTVARKILAGVQDLEQRFGIGHVVKVLTGTRESRLRKFGHDQLESFGTLDGYEAKTLTNLTYQLVEQGLLERTPGDRPLLKLNARSREILAGERGVRLALPKKRVIKATRLETDAWLDVDRGLFEHLREVRRQLAEERNVPAFVIFGDATLRDMAARKPDTREKLLAVHGVGRRKAQQYGEVFLREIAEYGQNDGGGMR